MAQIVELIVSQQSAPTPSSLQRTGAFVSQGATTLTAGTYKLLTKAGDLATSLVAAQNLSSLSWLSSVVTATTAADHGYPIGQTINLTIAGATPAGYNGTFPCAITSTTEFTYPLASNPGAETVPGTVVVSDLAELTAMNTTFWAQGTNTSVYVLELGVGNPASGVTALTTFIDGSPQFFYSYLVPREWAAEPTYATMVGNYEANTAKTYFFTTSSATTYTNFTNLQKSVLQLIEAPSIPATEFSMASLFWKALSYNPSSTNRVTPMANSFVYGVTPYPTFQNSSTLATYFAANVNVIGTAAEGGLGTAMVVGGFTMDGNDFTYWYSVDWTQINLDMNLANEVINGANDPVSPLYYDQSGINRLQTRAAQTMKTATSYGLALGNVKTAELSAPNFAAALAAGTYLGNTVIDADPFASYTAENPNDFGIGRYAGIAVVYTPNRGFTQIIVNVVVTTFV